MQATARFFTVHNVAVCADQCPCAILFIYSCGLTDLDPPSLCKLAQINVRFATHLFLALTSLCREVPVKMTAHAGFHKRSLTGSIGLGLYSTTARGWDIGEPSGAAGQRPFRGQGKSTARIRCCRVIQVSVDPWRKRRHRLVQNPSSGRGSLKGPLGSRRCTLGMFP